MSEPLQKGARRAALKRRREEVEERLAAFGFARGPRRLPRGAGAEEFERTRARRLRLALESLGPVFSAFGLYLSARADLLTARDCHELATTESRTAPAPPALIESLFERETGLALAEAYRDFDATPFESRLFHQSHYCVLGDGRPAVVKILRPGVVERAAMDAQLLPLLKFTFAGFGVRDDLAEGALADFGNALRRQTDLSREAEALGVLVRSAEEFEMLGAPAPRAGLCTRGVLTVERLPGLRLEESFAPHGVSAEEGAWPGGADIDRRNLARLFCLVWLRQALRGEQFPVEPRAADVSILRDGRVAFTGGPFAGLAPEARENLWDYLVALSTDNPDRACSSLLREMKDGGRPGGASDLLRRFRQLVPRREGPWFEGDEGLAEYLFAQWRLAGECGYAPQAHMPDFYRGLCGAVRLAHQLAPGHDALTQAVQELRLIEGLGQMREMMGYRRVGDEANKYMALMFDLPQRLDEALTLAAEGRAHIRLQVPETAERQRSRNSAASASALLLVLGAFVLLSPRLKELLGAWADGVGALVLLVLGGALLRAVSRT